MPPGLHRYFGAQFYLEDLLGRRVDLSTEDEVRGEIRPYVKQDSVCDAEHEGREWRFYVQDMVEFGEKVLSFTDGMDQEAFASDALTYDATLRNIQLIGEAATHVPAKVRESHSDIPWRAIVGARNRLAHSYLHISDSVIWSIVQDAVPDLLPKLRRLLAAAEPEGS